MEGVQKASVAQTLPLKLKVCYSLGQLGWSLILGLISTWLVWFYFPPQGAEGSIDVLYIPQGYVLGVLTVIGIITMLGRFVDAITDPWIATLSDRSNHPKGRRISFMAKGAVPFALMVILVFFAPVKGISIINVLWLGVTLIAMYIFYTMYVTPYFALISEFGHTPEEKLNLSTYISATWFVGLAISSNAAAIWGMLQAGGMDRIMSVRVAIIGLTLIGLIFMLIPVFTINERKYSVSQPSQDNVIQSVKATFKNKDFRCFIFSDLVYWFAVTMFTTGSIYYITVLLRLPESWNGTMITSIGVISFLFYPLVNISAKKLGKKKLTAFAFLIFSFVYLFTGLLGKFSIGAESQAWILIILSGLPMAILGILPNAIIADIAEYDASITGNNREAMFFGVRTFMSKLGQMFAMLLFSSLANIGNSVGNDIGIRLTAFFAAIACLTSMVLFLRYNEKRVINKIKE